METLLNCGITRSQHHANIKNKAPSKLWKGWISRCDDYLIRADKSKEAPVGAVIRKNRTKTLNAQGKECRYITRLLGGNNKSLAITIEDGKEPVDVFPAETFDGAKNILSALINAVKTNEAVQLEVATQLAEHGYEDTPTTFVEGGI